MIDIMQTYSDFCQNKGIPFSLDSKITSYDDTTLFCPAGMQQFKKQFKDRDINGKTIANIQSCLRLLDLDSVGDGSHFLYFNMIGLFSFRQMNVYQAIKFWIEFLFEIGVTPDYVSVHLDKYEEWKKWHEMIHNIPVRMDSECVWSDGELSGYCTEFYVNNSKFKNLEIGNIVNICGDCIDVGFGLERLHMVVNGQQIKTDVELLEESIQKILDCGVVPSNKLQGYVLRRLMRLLWKKGGYIGSAYFKIERERQENLIQKYLKLKDRYTDKSKEWWFGTHGIDIDLVE